jgi:hypothetical protein
MNKYEATNRAIKVAKLCRAAEEAGITATELATGEWARRLVVSHAEVTEPSDTTWRTVVAQLAEWEYRGTTRLPVHETPEVEVDMYDPFEMTDASFRGLAGSM